MKILQFRETSGKLVSRKRSAFRLKHLIKPCFCYFYQFQNIFLDKPFVPNINYFIFTLKN